MIHNILHNRTLLLVVIIIHLLAGFSYGHAEIAEGGDLSQAGNPYLDAETACHEEQQGQAQGFYDVDCAGSVWPAAAMVLVDFSPWSLPWVYRL